MIIGILGNPYNLEVSQETVFDIFTVSFLCCNLLVEQNKT